MQKAVLLNQKSFTSKTSDIFNIQELIDSILSITNIVKFKNYF